MRNCFIPMCDAKCRDWTKRMMFMAPKDDIIFQQWLDCLPQQRRAFRKSDRICERHFDKEDIITTWDHIINGEVHKLERTKPKLKREAVPTLNLDYTPPLNWLLRKSKDSQKTPSAKKVKLEPENEPIVPPEKENDDGQAQELNNKQIKSNLKPIDELHIVDACTLDIVEEETIPEVTLQKFDSLFDDVFEVMLPSTLWGWHRDCNRKFICVSQFSVEFMTSIKTIIIFNNLITKTYVLDKEIDETELVDTDSDNLSAIIDRIDKLQLCSGTMGTERKNCLYVLHEENQNKCGYCRKSNTVESVSN